MNDDEKDSREIRGCAVIILMFSLGWYFLGFVGGLITLSSYVLIEWLIVSIVNKIMKKDDTTQNS